MQTTSYQAVPASPQEYDPALITDTGIEGVLIQFFTTNRGVVPTRLMRPYKPGPATGGSSSAELVPDTKEVALQHLLGDLEAAGFILAEGFAYLRDDKKKEGDKPGQKPLYGVRFQFYPARKFSYASHAQMNQAQVILKPILRTIAEGAFWQVMVHNNTTSHGRHGIGIRCKARLPLYGADGRLMVRRLNKDEEPVPLQPAKTLRLLRQRFELV